MPVFAYREVAIDSARTTKSELGRLSLAKGGFTDTQFKGYLGYRFMLGSDEFYRFLLGLGRVLIGHILSLLKGGSV